MKSPTTAQWRVLMAEMSIAVRRLRQLLGWSQQTLADRATLSQGAISRMENQPTQDLPLYTAVKVFTTLAAGAEGLELPPSGAAEWFLAAAKTFLDPIALTAPLDPELVRLVQAYHRLPPERREAVRRLVEAAADLFTHSSGDETPLPPGPPVSTPRKETALSPEPAPREPCGPVEA